jgi:hypothetical protein
VLASIWLDLDRLGQLTDLMVKPKKQLVGSIGALAADEHVNGYLDPSQVSALAKSLRHSPGFGEPAAPLDQSQLRWRAGKVNGFQRSCHPAEASRRLPS